MVKSYLNLSAAEYLLRKNLEAFLKSNDEAKELPDHQRSSPAPKHALTAEPLASNLGEYHRSRVLAELQSCLKIVQDCDDAILKPNDKFFNRHYANLQIALGRQYWMLHRAQDANVWRDRQIPQERHNSDPWPLEPSPSSSSTSRLDALEREFEHIAFDALRRGIPPDEVQSLPECIAARTRFEVEQKSLVKHERQSIDRGIITKGEYKTLRHAREGVAEWVESWANAEAEVRRFLEYMTQEPEVEIEIETRNQLDSRDKPAEVKKSTHLEHAKNHTGLGEITPSADASPVCVQPSARRFMTAEQARLSAEAIVKSEGWPIHRGKPSKRKLAEKVRCSHSTLDKAIEESSKLRKAYSEASNSADGSGKPDELSGLIAEQEIDSKNRHA